MFKICGGLAEGGGVRDAVEASHDVIVVLQLLPTLEFVHACVGLVSKLLQPKKCAVFWCALSPPPCQEYPCDHNDVRL